mgnify:CR=1 FL=1
MTNRRPLAIPILILVLAAACGGHVNLQRRTAAATFALDAATATRAAVLEQLEADVAAAVAGVADQGERDRRVAAIRARYTAAGGPVDLANAVNRIGLAYVRAMLVAGDDTSAWRKATPILRDALAIYVELRKLVGDRLPPVPAVVAGLVSS